jgi:hypothetical protein
VEPLTDDPVFRDSIPAADRTATSRSADAVQVEPRWHRSGVYEWKQVTGTAHGPHRQHRRLAVPRRPAQRRSRVASRAGVTGCRSPAGPSH